MKAWTPGKTIDYVLKEDRDKKGKPKSGASIFKLKSLSVEDYFAIQNITWQEGEGIGSANLATLIAGLVDWQEVRDDDGKLIPFKLNDEICDMGNIEHIPGPARMELIGAIRKINTVSEDERKN